MDWSREAVAIARALGVERLVGQEGRGPEQGEGPVPPRIDREAEAWRGRARVTRGCEPLTHHQEEGGGGEKAG